eukprot:3546382-Karenia_brevis.AAC.1
MVVMACGVSSSSVFSKIRNSQFNGLSWDGQAVLNKDVGVRRHKTNFLLRKIKRSDFGCVQELHGSAGLAKAVLNPINATHLWRASFVQGAE